MIVFLAPVLFLFACQEGPDWASDLLNEQLRNQLESVSPTGRIDFFKLPDAHELDQIPQDPNNPLTFEKVLLGQKLFHETGIAVQPKKTIGKYTYSCASCHHADAGFQSGRKQGIGEGGTGFGARGEGRIPDRAYTSSEIDIQPIRSPAALNVAFQKVMLWNGQFGAKGVNRGTEAFWVPGKPVENNNLNFEGVETQAIAGIGVHRLNIAPDELFPNTNYKEYFDAAFPYQNEAQRYSNQNAGLAIAAYERTLLATEAPFQRWLSGDLGTLNESQKRGAILFFGKANCVSCHTGPALSSVDTVKFYGIGMNDLSGPDVVGVGADAPEHLGRGGFTQNPEDMYKFKVPQLYNLKNTGFYGHGGSFSRIIDVITYKNNGISENSRVPTEQLAPQFAPLGLTEDEVQDISLFVQEALYDPSLHRYAPSALPSTFCFPNNDAESRVDLGCQ